MLVDEFINKAKKAEAAKTLYIMGCFGSPMTPSNKTRAKNEHPYNKRPERAKMIDAAAADCFGFDCVNLIKGILWGGNGDTSRSIKATTCPTWVLIVFSTCVHKSIRTSVK